ncbi:MAG: nucleotidyltransferase [Ruminococcus sp.]|nr:nucleotidyltransferase [Ruminococcus sp.]
MKIVGLITEYNPFHNGHKYHIEQAKKITGADAAIVVMSGDYVQRGMPAIMPKRLRAEMALNCGAAAVFELPVCYSTGSAELFALGAVSLLDKLGIVDYLCFGSECNDLQGLQAIADILCEEPTEYKQLLQEALRSGLSFPAARQEALGTIMKTADSSFLLNDPNNILGVEYLKALRRINSNIKPCTIKRQDSHYHDRTLCTTYSSASAIRSLFAYSDSSSTASEGFHKCGNTRFSGISGELAKQVPSSCFKLLEENHQVLYPISEQDFSLLLKYKLLNKTPEKLIRYADVSEELANRIYANLNNFFDYRQFCELLKTKEVTQTRINRALLHIMLGIKKKEQEIYLTDGYHYYAHLLGFRKDCEKVISAISKTGTLPLLTKLYKQDKLSDAGQRMLNQDILASNLYNSVITEKFRTPFKNEYNHGILKL